jgi:Raf kinase inhibitor-like YbhB/YbcL family protein
MLVLAACGGVSVTTTAPSAGPTVAASPSIGEGRTAAVTLTLTSPAFSEGGPIPSEHTCDGGDQPIPLAWSGVPDGTAELALIMDDPDARGFVHWVVVGIPASASGLEDGSLPSGAREGATGSGTGYGGPCPPSGTHRYQFTLYALSAPLGLSGAPTADEVRAGAADKTLGEALLTGIYARAR